MKPLQLALAAVFAFSVHSAATAQPAATAPIRLDVDATDIPHRIFKVRETLPVRPGPLTLLYPEWLPGKHAPRGPIEKLAGLKITAGGRALAWTRDPVDVYAFHLDVPPGVSEIEASFQYLSPTAPNQGRIEVTPEMLNLQWNAVILYPAGPPVRNIQVQPRLALPPGWGFGTALRPMDPAGEPTRFQAVSVETLVDSPVFAGRHFRRFDLDPGAKRPVALNVVAETPDGLVADAATLEKHRNLVRQADRLFGARHYAHYDFLLATGERMGGIGLEHHQSSENKVPGGYFTDFAKAIDDRDLLAHEYTHSWNGKHRRPADLATTNYNMPMEGSLLWVYEGQTQYWGFVLGARAGLLSGEEALGALAETAAAYESRAGRRWRPLADTTQDPVIAARRPQPWLSWQRSEDYYSEGLLIWLDVDTLIRSRSGGKRSLDDFARAFFGGSDGEPSVAPYGFEDVVQALNAVEPYDWATFLKQRVDEIALNAPLDGLGRGGWRLAFSDKPSVFTAALETANRVVNLTYSLGLSLTKDGEIASVLWDSPAFNAGLTVSGKIVAVNGLAYDADRLKAAVTAGRSGQPIELLVKDGDYFRTVSLNYTGGLRYPILERSGGPDLLSRIYAPRPALNASP